MYLFCPASTSFSAICGANYPNLYFKVVIKLSWVFWAWTFHRASTRHRSYARATLSLLFRRSATSTTSTTVFISWQRAQPRLHAWLHHVRSAEFKQAVCLSVCLSVCLYQHMCNGLASVVQKVYNAIYRINHYPALEQLGPGGPFLKKSRNFTGHFRVSSFPLYLKNGENLIRQTSQLFFFLLPWKHVKRSGFQSKRLAYKAGVFLFW